MYFSNFKICFNDLQVLGIIVGVLLQDHDAQTTDFHQLPYHRILITLFLDLNAPDPVLESINYSVSLKIKNKIYKVNNYVIF